MLNNLKKEKSEKFSLDDDTTNDEEDKSNITINTSYDEGTKKECLTAMDRELEDEKVNIMEKILGSSGFTNWKCKICCTIMKKKP